MVEYPIVSILWLDHLTKISAEIPKNPDEAVISPTLTVGILLSETDKTYLIAHDIESHEDYDVGTYTIIFKSTVEAIKTYGSLLLNEIRFT